MVQTEIHSISDLPSLIEKQKVVRFLATHLEQYSDTREDIEKALDFALTSNGTSHGGLVIVFKDKCVIIAAAVINKTGMEGYIPENILVYIATHKEYRGKGIATRLMKLIIQHTQGNIALHVEHDNPALHLYQKFGFTNKYLEMRLNKKEVEHGVLDA